MHTRTVADHVVRIYLPQARLYLGGDGDPLQLRQITTKSSAAVGAVLRLTSRRRATRDTKRRRGRPSPSR